ncbi:MAG: PEP-CTERM sorting domain-containing protein [Bryobacteraceae bacterium]
MKLKLALVSLLASVPVFATTVYGTNTPQFIGSNITQTRAADSFTIGSSETITDVQFFASVFSGVLADNFSGSITYAFYNDAAGSLGSIVTSGTVNGLTGVSWGVCGAGQCSTIDFALNSALNLGAGTYWLEIHEGTSLSNNDGSAITWAGFNAVSGISLFSSSLETAPGTNSVSERSFSLFNNAASVPEPSSMLLIGGGLAGILLYKRRKNSPTR